MKRPSKPALALRDLLLTPSKMVASGSREVWDIIGQWQREGLVRVRPVKPEVAEVTITDAGRARVGVSATQAAGERA